MRLKHPPEVRARAVELMGSGVHIIEAANIVSAEFGVELTRNNLKNWHVRNMPPAKVADNQLCGRFNEFIRLMKPAARSL